MRRHYLELFGFDYWATLKLLDLCDPHAPYRMRMWFSTLVLERELWITRIVSGPFEQDMKTVLTWDEIRHKLAVTQKSFLDFLGQLDNRDFQQLLEWSPVSGNEAYSLKDIVSFLMTQGNLVRGRMLEALEREGAVPPDISFLTYARNMPAPVIQWRFGQ
jgi:uncharacterized damage-inducible protein DinB